MLLLIGFLMALSALAIRIDPGRAPAFLLIGLATVAVPWRDALARRRWHGSAARLDLGCAGHRHVLVAQLVALTEPISSGRPVAGRLTYLSVLALWRPRLGAQRPHARRAGLGRLDGSAGRRLPDPVAGRSRPHAAGPGLALVTWIPPGHSFMDFWSSWG